MRYRGRAGACPQGMAPQEPHLNAGVAESAHVQATPSPASNDAPPTRSCNPVKNHSSSDSRPFVVPSPTLRPLRSLREIISRQARQARQEDIGLGAFFCIPFRVFRVFRSSLPPLGVAASAPSFQFQVSSFHSPFAVLPLPLPVLLSPLGRRQSFARAALNSKPSPCVSAGGR